MDKKLKEFRPKLSNLAALSWWLLKNGQKKAWDKSIVQSKAILVCERRKNNRTHCISEHENSGEINAIWPYQLKEKEKNEGYLRKT